MLDRDAAIVSILKATEGRLNGALRDAKLVLEQFDGIDTPCEVDPAYLASRTCQMRAVKRLLGPEGLNA